MDTASSRALVEKKVEQKESIFNRLPSELARYVISFLVDKDRLKEGQSAPLPSCTFFFDLTVSYALQATHNLLHRIHVNETLEFIQQHPKILFIPVEVKDIHGQRYRGKPVQVLASAGEFNPIEMKADAKPHGLVHLVGSCFPNEADFKSQIAERFRPGHETGTKRRRERIRQAIRNLIDEAAKSPDISNTVPLETMLDLLIAKKFKEAIKPDPNDVVTQGLAGDMRIFLDFINIFKANFDRLGGKWSRRSDFIDAIVWPALQATSALSDLEVYAKGIINVVDSKCLPDRFDFSGGRPQILDGIGSSHFFDLFGTKCRGLARGPTRLGGGSSRFSNLMSNKSSSITQLMRSRTHAPRCCLIM